jgi:hypothetical protein
MLRNELNRCPREIRHDLIVAPPGGLRLRLIARYSVAAYRFAREWALDRQAWVDAGRGALVSGGGQRTGR